MVADVYETILIELSEKLNIPKLTPDPNYSCLIRMDNGCEIQIEPDKSGENITLGCQVAPLAPGSYRTSVFREALKYNGTVKPKSGVFAWSHKADKLVLFCTIPFKNLNGSKLADIIYPFTALALKWQETIKAGQVPIVETAETGTRTPSSGLFGLRP